MEKEIGSQKLEYVKSNVKKRIWKKIVFVMASVVVFCTTYALILPAITMSGRTYCGKEEHSHGEECYKMELICGISTVQEEVHVHDDSCYTTSKELVCSLEEGELHVHDESCYIEEEVLICSMEEEEPPSHTHTEACYEKVLVCEKNEHIHQQQCYSNPNADVETKEDWEATVPKELSGIRVDDFIAVAKSQLGYEESTKNYQVTSSGDKKGYTRYGDWYGDTYGHWCAMFLSFCLNYADIGQDIIPYESNCQSWTEKLDKQGLYHVEDSFEPKPGDLVFFETVNENVANHVGVLVELVGEDELKTIEGNASDTVKYRTYEKNHEKILGYGRLPEKEEDAPVAENSSLPEATEEIETTKEIIEETADGYMEVSDSDSFYKQIDEGTENSPVYIRLTEDFALTNGSVLISKEKQVLIDLNGQTIELDEQDCGFLVEGGTLIIEDSMALQESEPILLENSEEIQYSLYGNSAIYETDSAEGNGRLTYYVTESQASNTRTGATRENLVLHQAAIKGKMKGSSESPMIKVVENGTFILKSGALTEGQNRAIEAENGSVFLEGGYVCGISSEKEGGAVYCAGEEGLVRVSGTVLAANSSYKQGGAVAVEKAALEILEGAILSGNCSLEREPSEEEEESFGGGAVFCKDGSLQMSGGFITNNRAEGPGCLDGGGGILLSGESKYVMTEGYITGNQAMTGGGLHTEWNSPVEYEMTGGSVCSNYAKYGPGGGLSINKGATAKISAGRINNNRTDTTESWGGGAVAAAEESKLFINNVLILQNHAMGFGGGIAGASTGSVSIAACQGAAVYDNEAEGQTEHMIQNESEPEDDTKYGFNDAVFMEAGYEDIYCGSTGVVEPMMLGGESSGWQGSADGSKVSAGEGLTIKSASTMGLTANPAEAGRDSAQKEGLATVFINGNSSNTHGGGVMSAGSLVIGEADKIFNFSRIELSGLVFFKSGDGEMLEMEEDQFHFYLKEENTGALIASGRNDQLGNIVFDKRIPLMSEGEFSYLLTQEQAEEDGITKDDSRYRIRILVEGETLDQNQQYRTAKISVEKNDSSGWGGIYEMIPDPVKAGEIQLELGQEAAFTNYRFENVTIRAVREWEEEEVQTEKESIRLYQNGELYETAELSEHNGWSYTWKDLPANDSADSSETEYTYDVLPVEEEEQNLQVETTVENEDSETVLLYTIRSGTDTDTEAGYTIDITKVSSADSSITLEGAYFVLKDAQGTPVQFVMKSAGAYTYDSGDGATDSEEDTTDLEEGTAESEDSIAAETELVTGTQGKLVLYDIPAGTYLLEETKAPPNYKCTDPMEVVLSDETPDGVLVLQIEDPMMETFILPETGGIGVGGYLTLGTIFMLSSLSCGWVLNYKKKG